MEDETGQSGDVKKPFDFKAAAQGVNDAAGESLEGLEVNKVRALSWLCASIVAFNAGGVVAAISALERSEYQGWSVMMFGYSLLACFLTGLAWFIAQMRIITRFTRLRNIVREPDIKTLVSDEYKLAVNSIANYEKEYVPATLLGLIAIFVTIYASVAFVRALPVPDKAELRRCAVIEHEMARGTPRRSDLPDVFQALGCRPQLDQPPMRPGTRGLLP